MSKTHKIEKGECLITVAGNYHYSSWKKLKEEPKNREKLENTDPTCVPEGITIHLPEHETQEITISTGQEHHFIIKRPDIYHTLKLIDAKEDNIKGRSFIMDVDTYRKKDQTTKGNTDEDGAISVKVPFGTKSGVIALKLDEEDPDKEIEIEFLVGEKPPLTKVAENQPDGEVVRLNALHYKCGSAMVHLKNDVDKDADKIKSNSMSLFKDSQTSGDGGVDDINEKLEKYDSSVYLYGKE